MRVYYHPGATAHERLEAFIASYLRSKPEVPPQVAELLAWATDCGPAREVAIREVFSGGCVLDPAEALGMARAVLLLCGVTPEHGLRLTGQPRTDFARLMEGEFHHRSLESPESYAAPSLLEAYCHMGAGFARGVDRIFEAATGQPLAEHLRRAMALLPPTLSFEASSG